MYDDGRLVLKLISQQVFRQYMDYRNQTNRSLSAATRGPDGRPRAGRAIIGHLRSGQRTTCSAPVARAIEEALNAPPGSLFVPSVTIGQRASRQTAA